MLEKIYSQLNKLATVNAKSNALHVATEPGLHLINTKLIVHYSSEFLMISPQFDYMMN